MLHALTVGMSTDQLCASLTQTGASSAVPVVSRLLLSWVKTILLTPILVLP